MGIQLAPAEVTPKKLDWRYSPWSSWLCVLSQEYPNKLATSQL